MASTSLKIKNERGIALVMVLWISILLSIIAGSFAIITRTENLQARHLFDNAHVRYIAQAGVHLAVYQLLHPSKEQHWLRDTRPYQVSFEDAELEIRIQDEGGRLDLNKANESQLKSLFELLELDEEQTIALVDAVMDWRDKDKFVRLNGAESPDYQAAGYAYGAKDAPFEMVEELQQVMGMNFALYQRLESALTVYSNKNSPVVALAPREILLTLPDVDIEFADKFIEQRELTHKPGEPILPLPNGTTPVVTAGTNSVFTITSKATLKNDVWTMVKATVRLGNTPDGKPFTVLRWEEGV